MGISTLLRGGALTLYYWNISTMLYDEGISSTLLHDLGISIMLGDGPQRIY